MDIENIIKKLFKDGLGECPPPDILLELAGKKDIPEPLAGHINLCPVCSRTISTLSEDSTDDSEEPIEIDWDEELQELFSKNPDALSNEEIDVVFNYMIEQGMSVGAFGVSDLEELKSYKVKRQIVKDHWHKYKK